MAGSGIGRAVGFAGLGTMGGGMARRLADAGFAVTGFDTDAGAAGALAGHPGAAAAADVAGLAAPVVVTMLPDGAQVRRVAELLLPAMERGSVLADMSSSAPRDTRSLAELAAGHGVLVVDAPVSGSPSAARAGSLTIMAGGTPEALDAAEPVLTALGTVHRVGPSGAGHALKALNNLLSSVNLAAVTEVLLAGRAYGLEPATMLRVINDSTGGSHASRTKLPDHVLPGGFASGFALRLMLKDITIGAGLLDAAGGPADLGRATAALWRQAFEELPEGADNVEVVRWLEGRAGVELRG